MYSDLHRRFGAVRRITRRELLKRAAMAAATLGLSAGQARPDRATRIAIVGAGLAGLCAAFEARARGFEARVFEARPRIGGRAHTLRRFAGEKHVEAGGELIGANHATWIHYAERFDLSLVEPPDEDNPDSVVLGGEVLSAAAAEQLYEEMSSVLTSDIPGLALVKDPIRPWTATDAARLDAQTVAAWIDAARVSERCRQALHASIAADCAVATNRASYLALLAAMVAGGGPEAFWTESEQFRCRQGTDALARAFHERLPSDAVQLRTPVSAITSGPQTIRVVLRDGASYEADYLILTAPPPTWQQIHFDPPLPRDVAPQSGSVAKVLLSLPERFWRAQTRSGDTLSDGLVNYTWRAGGEQPGRDDVLVLYAGGPSADRLNERPAGSRVRDAASALEAVYPGLATSFTRSASIDWMADPWTRCGFSFAAPGQVTTLGPVLERGIGRLHFAGEYCSFGFPGYMEGALESAARVVRTIAARQGRA